MRPMATMTDIAREAGVSLSTVSYALSGKRTISASTRERIEAAIARLEYHPAASARALAKGRTSLLGVAVPRHEDVDDHVIMEFVGSILEAAHEADDDVLLVAAEDHARTLKVVEEGKVDALVVMDLVEDDPRLPALARLHRPVVLIGYPQDAAGIACVDFDFLSGAMLAVRELSLRGARRIALLTPHRDPTGPVPTYARRAGLGFEMGCRELGLPAPRLEVDAEPEAIAALVAEHLSGPDAVDALVVHHERALPHLTRALSAAGVDVPGALQLVAIAPDDVAAAGAHSSIELPIPAIGRTAVTMALELVEDPSAPPHSRLLSPTFVPRETTRDR